MVPEKAEGGDPLVRVLAALQAQDAARIELHAAITAARAVGLTWAELGELLGMSRQAVFKRFGGTTQEELVSRERCVADLERGAAQVFSDIAAGRIDAVVARMPAEVADVLTPDKIRSTWDSVVRASGELTSTELLAVEQGAQAYVDPGDQVNGSAVVALSLRHSRGEWCGRVAYDGADRLVGLLVLPPGAPAPF